MNLPAELAVCARSCSPGNTPNQRSPRLSPATVRIATRDFRLRPARLRSENASEEPVSRAQPVNIRSRELIKSEFILRRSRCHGLALILPVIGRGGTRRRNRGFTVKHKRRALQLKRVRLRKTTLTPDTYRTSWTFHRSRAAHGADALLMVIDSTFVSSQPV